MQEFRCDARVDCLDGSDEWRCTGASGTGAPGTGASGTSAAGTSAPGTSAPGTNSPARAEDCAPPALRCDNRSRCVPLPQLCDGARDCADGADEADRCGECARTATDTTLYKRRSSRRPLEKDIYRRILM